MQSDKPLERNGKSMLENEYLDKRKELEEYAKNFKTSTGEPPSVILVPRDVFLRMCYRAKLLESLQIRDWL